jgi:signal transduction histidine kinase/ActR/RegA family two-component response regulator
MLGYTEEELLQMKVDDIHREEDLKDVASTFEAQARGEMTLAPEIPCLRKDGTIMYADISSNGLLIDKTQCVLGLFSDITERKLAEEERRKLEEQVQQTQRFESLGVLAGGVAHDFNNLLTSILGNADMALETLPEASPAWRRIAHIEKASINAADLCSQMLAYAGKGRFIVKPTNLNTVVKNMSQLLGASISKDVILDLVFEDELPAVEADATQMQQVVMNLVTNASEAVGEESGMVSVTTGVMDCNRSYLGRSYSRDDQPEGRYVYIEVTDTGCGMDEQTQAKMFEPFFTTKFTGRGLGLAAVLGIIRGHGGAIVVDSQPGRGTTVTALFPALDHYEPLQTEPQQNVEDPVHTFSGTVLVVDDEESVREISAFMLETAGFDVITAKNGFEALEMYLQHADVISCVLLDLTMPHMDGIKVFEQLREIRDDVRVVLASGYSEEEISKRYASSGIAAFIHKPYLLSTLKAKLHEALSAS